MDTDRKAVGTVAGLKDRLLRLRYAPEWFLRDRFCSLPPAMEEVRVLTPLSRPQNLPVIQPFLSNVKWTGIVRESQLEPGVSKLKVPKNCALHPVVLKEPYGEGMDPCYQKVVDYFRHIRSDNTEEWVMILCDDCLPDPVFLRDLRMGRFRDTAVVVISARRGQRTPLGARHHHSDLVAHPDNMRPGRIDIGQLVMRRWLWRTALSFNLLNPYVYESDGVMAGWIKRHFWRSSSLRYAPEYAMLFNYLEPGRWKHTVVSSDGEKHD
ncbi:hypothetical protein KGP36_02505 [Patescibacteria group bacterium]|nr:hypothetical protein [Patescibacteria group bacterium]